MFQGGIDANLFQFTLYSVVRFVHFHSKIIFQLKMLLLVAATLGVFYSITLFGHHVRHQQLHSPTYQFSADSNDEDPTDPDLWYFSLTTSYNLITTRQFNRHKPEEAPKDIQQYKTAENPDLLVIEQELKKEDNAAILTEVYGTSHQTTKPTQEKRHFTSEHELRNKETETEKETEHATTAEPYLENIKLSEYNDQSDGLHNSAAYQALQKRLDILFEESKDVFDLLPNKYLPDYKSFCWFDSLNVFQCLASVYLAGMPKCGTTDLFQKLMVHPELTTQSHHSNGGPEKETFYWTRRRVGRPVSFTANPRVPPPKTLFSEFLLGTGAEKVKNSKEVMIVDGTPSLLWDLGGWETRYPGLDEPPYSNADLIHAVTPDAKILAILRNPTERLYSEYLYFWKGVRMVSEERTPQTFHTTVRREIKRFNKCVGSKSLRHCCYSSDHSVRLRIALGVYVCYIRDFLEVFGNNLIVETMNEYHSYPVETLDNIFYRIGVSKPNVDDLRNFIKNSKIYNVNTDVKEDVGEMLDETKELLNGFYKPYNSELATILKDSKYLFI